MAVTLSERLDGLLRVHSMATLLGRFTEEELRLCVDEEDVFFVRESMARMGQAGWITPGKEAQDGTWVFRGES